MSSNAPKDTNPKDVLGSNRIEMGLVSDLAIAEEALAMTEGMFKYGRFNYRIKGVKVSVYLAAARRHLAKYWNGEDRDPVTGVHHLGSARACMNVIFDAQALGILKDDRPPRSPGLVTALDDLEKRVAHLRELYETRDPVHYTIMDAPDVDYGGECCQVAGCEHCEAPELHIREVSRTVQPEGLEFFHKGEWHPIDKLEAIYQDLAAPADDSPAEKIGGSSSE